MQIALVDTNPCCFRAAREAEEGERAWCPHCGKVVERRGAGWVHRAPAGARGCPSNQSARNEVWLSERLSDAREEVERLKRILTTTESERGEGRMVIGIKLSREFSRRLLEEVGPGVFGDGDPVALWSRPTLYLGRTGLSALRPWAGGPRALYLGRTGLSAGLTAHLIGLPGERRRLDPECYEAVAARLRELMEDWDDGRARLLAATLETLAQGKNNIELRFV